MPRGRRPWLNPREAVHVLAGERSHIMLQFIQTGQNFSQESLLTSAWGSKAGCSGLISADRIETSRDSVGRHLVKFHRSGRWHCVLAARAFFAVGCLLNILHEALNVSRHITANAGYLKLMLKGVLAHELVCWLGVWWSWVRCSDLMSQISMVLRAFKTPVTI